LIPGGAKHLNSTFDIFGRLQRTVLNFQHSCSLKRMKLDVENRTVLLFIAALLFSAPLVLAAEVTVFAAASLTDALNQLAGAYEKQSGDKLIFNFGASSQLARQIEEGAPADVFFSADEAKMSALEKQDLLLTGTRKSRLSNTLVIVVAADSDLKIRSPDDLASPPVKHVALADPKAVPAGVYSKEFLEKRKLWPAVEGKVVPTENVRAALAAVESGNVEAGMVYKTDAAISTKVKVACEIPASEGPAISYPVAVLRGSRNTPAAQKFVEYLGSSDAAQVFQHYGFIVLK
jgi:molybdate transport system substrate-binding protein